MFNDYRHPIPKSRLKTIKIKAENGRFQRVPGPTHEEFSPSNRDHVLGALTQRGILVENTQEATLKKLTHLNAVSFSNIPPSKNAWKQSRASPGRAFATAG